MSGKNMDVDPTSFLARTIGAAVSLVWAPIRRLRAQKIAAEIPESFKPVDREVFDAALRRLAFPKDDDSIFLRTYDNGVRRYCTPAYLKSVNVQRWLGEATVTDSLHQVASAKALGSTAELSALASLQESFQRVALATSQEAEAVVSAVVAMLAAALSGQTDVLVVASHRETMQQLTVILSRFEDLASPQPATGSVLPASPVSAETLNSWNEAFASASTGLSLWPTTVGVDEHIERPELVQLIDIIAHSEQSVTALLGLPGAGKSALLARLCGSLRERSNIPVLAIKGDLLSPTVVNEEDLQRDLGLPEVPSKMLSRLAENGGAVLLVDQLDALAGHLDTKTGRLSVLLNLVKAAAAVRGIHVVISCRTFEFEHDIRLSKIEASPLELSLPAWEAVQVVLSAHGLTGVGWHRDAQEVLRVPQHLKTFLQLRESGVEEPSSNYTMMLNQLWKSRIEEAPGGAQAVQLAYEIANSMAEEEALWLASARYDLQRPQLNQLQAMGFLTESEKGSVGFTHQTIFEHVLARSFTLGKRLSTYVLARNDSLFVRPKLWAALMYLRDAEPTTYETELADIWHSASLRLHLRFLLIEFMGAQSAPLAIEESLIAEASENTRLLPIVLKSVLGSAGWFRKLSAGTLRVAMVNAATANMCIPVLSKAWDFDPHGVLRLLRDVWIPDAENDIRVLLVLEDSPNWNLEVVQVTKQVVSRHRFPTWRSDAFIAVIGPSHPEVAIDVLRDILDLELAGRKEEAACRKLKADAERPRDAEPSVAWYMEHDFLEPFEKLLNDDGWAHIPSLVAESPKRYMDEIWPFYLGVFLAMAELRPESASHFSYAQVYRVDYRFEGEGTHGLGPAPLLDAIVIAIQHLAGSAPKDFLVWVASNSAIELNSVQRLVAHGFAHNPSAMASQALAYILADTRRLFLSSATDWMSTSLRLVAACAPYWNQEELRQFEERVMNYSPVRPTELSLPEEIRRWPKLVRGARLRLLAALPTENRSADVQRLLDEAARAAPLHSPPIALTSGWVGPPMDLAQFVKASDEDIVNAFREISDDSEWDHPKYFGRGGNAQLSQVLGTFAREYPHRAMAITRKLKPEFGQRGAGYVLEALAEVFDAPEVMNLLIELLQAGFCRDEFRSSVVLAVSKLVKRDAVIRNEVIQVLLSWLPEGPPTAVVHHETSAPDSKAEVGESEFLLTGHPRIEFEPGGDYRILSALVGARLRRNEVSETIDMLSAYLANNQDKRVWAYLSDILISLPSLSPQKGSKLVGEVLGISSLDGTWQAAHLMAHVHHHALPQVMATLSRWRHSKNASACRGYGELVVLIALTNPAATVARIWLDELTTSSDEAFAREGAAASLVKLFWGNHKFRAQAADYLTRLLGRDEELVWHQVFGLFGEIERLEAEPSTVRLLKEIAKGIDGAPAPQDSYVVERLGTILPLHADVVARIAVRLVQLWRDQLTDVGSPMVTAGQEMMDLALTLHRTTGVELHGLQIFEQLIEIDAYQAREVLNQIDHRVVPNTHSVRPRLKRRGRARRSRNS